MSRIAGRLPPARRNTIPPALTSSSARRLLIRTPRSSGISGDWPGCRQQRAELDHCRRGLAIERGVAGEHDPGFRCPAASVSSANRPARSPGPGWPRCSRAAAMTERKSAAACRRSALEARPLSRMSSSCRFGGRGVEPGDGLLERLRHAGECVRRGGHVWLTRSIRWSARWRTRPAAWRSRPGPSRSAAAPERGAVEGLADAGGDVAHVAGDAARLGGELADVGQGGAGPGVAAGPSDSSSAARTLGSVGSGSNGTMLAAPLAEQAGRGRDHRRLGAAPPSRSMLNSVSTHSSSASRIASTRPTRRPAA